MGNYMITGTWDDITLVCCHRHAEPVPMVIQEGKTLFYACPKYHPENREPGEPACNNRLSIQDYMKMQEHLHAKIIEAELSDEKLNLTNYEWHDRKGVYYKILSQDNNKLIIQVYNKRAINS